VALAVCYRRRLVVEKKCLYPNMQQTVGMRFPCLATSKGVLLKRRNFDLASRCAMCLLEEESAYHLFAYYQWVSSLRSLALSLMGVSWVQPYNHKDELIVWKRRLKKSLVHGI